ncbi:S8 family serine peptidase [Taibaiella koreensis]|uniref:S8 family serine peptidase n=1 Tax=Taibaiella koreensis TaxID=1268548 RepID=UPI000E59A274|nr:S8 family serine peptidase [Taibaiella koreensis]
MKKTFILGLTLCLSLGGLRAQPLRSSLETVKLSGRDIPLQIDKAALRQALQEALSSKELAQVYLQFDRAPDYKLLEASGISLQTPIQPNVYLAICRSAAFPDAAGIAGWAPVAPADKIHPMLQPGGDHDAGQQTVLLSVLKGMSETELREKLAAYGLHPDAQQSWRTQDLWQLTLKADQVAVLAAAPFIRFINPLFAPQALNNQAIGFTNTQAAHQPVAIGGRDLHGEGVMIGIGDEADPQHIDYIDRIRSFNPNTGTTHAFHTTGTTVGNGIRDERYKGFASRSEAVEDFFSQIIANGATYNQDFGMVTSNNSYGNTLGDCSYAGTYDVYTQFADQQMRDIPELLTIFAAGNDGKLTCSPYPTGYATVAGSYQTAKNVLTVGDIGKTPLLEHLTSARGPVKDGRLKPEITAVGFSVISTIDNNNYALNSGTSIACPNVTGASGLLYQRYRQLHGGANPKSALIKTLLMNGATDLDIPGPDFRYGFGLMNVGHSLTMMEGNQYFSGTINTTQEQSFTVNIPANTSKAKIMLYWNDPAAAPLSASNLINDLDITVTTPSAATVLPLVLNPAPGQVATPAAPGIDRRNNVEQVTLDNPAAGAYTVKVKGFNVPEINQEFFVAYDFIPDGITLQYPFGGEALDAADSMRIYWEASAGANPFTLSYSTDNGGSWNTIAGNIGVNTHTYTWYPPAGISSNQCLIRVQRNSTTQQSQSRAFTMAGRPVATLNPQAEQCPGSIKISWNAIPGATGYRIYRKTGVDMAPLTIVTGTSYTYTGLNPDSTYWVAVAPLINGATGMRSLGLDRRPSDGQCTGTTAHGDLRLASVQAPGSGRQFTASSLGTAQAVTVLISNLDNQVANQYRIAYQVNGSAWQSQVYTDPVSAAGDRQITLGNLDMSAPGTYQIRAAITNLALADPVNVNDTAVLTVKQVANPVMNLSAGYTEGFEATGAQGVTGRGLVGIDGAEKWDFTQSMPKGRLQTFVNSAITISGTRSASMDNAGNQAGDIAGSSYNTLTGTFNLSQYTTSNWEVRCEFDYLLHGVPKFDTGNKVWIRGSENDPWLPLLNYRIDTNNLGLVYNSGSISLTDVLAAGGQNFSASTQIRFTQYDTSRIAAAYYGNGLTMDNFQLYLVTDDVQLLAIDSLYHYNCALGDQVPLKIRVRNGVNNTVYNVGVFYQVNGGAVISGLIDSIQGKDTTSYTFSQPMDLSATAVRHNLSTWIYVATDTYRLNDSIMNFGVRNQPVIATFPYLQTFEENDGNFYAEGNSSSWAYGTPISPHIDHAASGAKAWKTNLNGNYNRLEVSYLYSPCFEIGSMTQPMLSFNLATDMEDPDGTNIFDVSYVEYSNDGYTWKKLGASGQGTNWYDNETAQAWARSRQDYWHVATIPLPKDGPVISIRFVLQSDQGTEREGVAIDDIHIYDLQHPIFDQQAFPDAMSKDIAAGQQAEWLSGNAIGFGLINGVSALGNTQVQDYKHAQFINDDSTQYYLPKNFVVQTAQAPGDSVLLRFYIPDEAMRTIRDDEQCYSCSKVREVQGLGITQYSDPNKSVENNTLADNVNGSYTFTPKEKIRWIPYDIGYYAETKVKSFSEFWFNDGGPTKDQPLPANLFDFTAQHYGARQALLNWTSYIDAQTMRYEIQRADASLSFVTVGTLNAIGNNGQAYSYIDTPLLNGPAAYYRIRYTMQNGAQYVSLIRRVDWSDADGSVIVYPNPVRNGVLNLDWFKGTDDELQWSIYSVVGQKVFSGYANDNNYSGKYSFDLSRIPLTPGLYVLRVVSGKDKWEFKIVYQ